MCYSFSDEWEPFNDELNFSISICNAIKKALWIVPQSDNYEQHLSATLKNEIDFLEYGIMNLHYDDNVTAEVPVFYCEENETLRSYIAYNKHIKYFIIFRIIDEEVTLAIYSKFYSYVRAGQNFINYLNTTHDESK